jgi:N-acetylmuramoyl-L-alanine amidase
MRILKKPKHAQKTGGPPDEDEQDSTPEVERHTVAPVEPAVAGTAETPADRQSSDAISGDGASGPRAGAGFFELSGDELSDFEPAGLIVAHRKPLNLVPALKVVALVVVLAAIVTGIVLIWPSSTTRVPSLIGRSLADAMDHARSSGFDPAVRGWKYSESQADGTVLSQTPKPLETVQKGAGIILIVSKGPRPEEGPQPGSTAVQTSAPSNPTGPYAGRTICIDPGGQMNPGEDEWSDPGMTRRNAPENRERGAITGNPEYLVNMDIGMKLKDLLEKDGIKVAMTRESNDVKLTSVNRAEVAANAGADLLLSIHCPSSTDETRMGTQTLYPADSQYTSGIYQNSKAAALFIQSELLKSCGTDDFGARSDDDNTILNWSKVPVVMAEAAYLSNPRDDSLLAQEDFRWKVAWGLRNGVIKYLNNP